MSYDDKIARAKTLLEEFNSQIDESDKLDIEKFLKKLKQAGGVNEAMLVECTWEELQKCGLPSLVARKVATIFREPIVREEEKPGFVSDKKAAKMAPRYLIQVYDPKEKGSAVHKRLAELSGGKPFLVFNSNGTVNVDVSEKLLQEIRSGFPERNEYVLDNKPVKVQTVGIDPQKKIVDENPLYAGRPLRPDGTCDQMNRSWDGVPLVIRQLFYLAITKTGEIKMNHDKAHELLDLALTPDSEKKIRSRYKKASILLDELTEAGTAPTLKMTLNAEESKMNNPFGNHRTY